MTSGKLARVRYSIVSFLIIFLAIYFSGCLWDYFFQSQEFYKLTDVIGYPLFANYNNRGPLYKYVFQFLSGVSVTLGLVRFANEELESNFFVVNKPTFLYSLILSESCSFIYNKNFIFMFVIVYFLFHFLHMFCYKSNNAGNKIIQNKSRFLLYGFYTISVFWILFFHSNYTGWMDSNVFIKTQWMPLSLAILGSLGTLLYLLIIWRRGTSDQILSTKISDFLFIPIVIFLVTARVEGDIALSGDFFHLGEKIAPLTLALKGWLPWRDFLFVHGIWDDFLKYSPGMWLWESSVRGAFNFYRLIVTPFYWISIYLMLLVVFEGRARAALLGMIVAMTISLDPFRFPLYPVILMALFCWINTRLIFWVVILAFLIATQVFISPEFGLLSLAVGASLLINDVTNKGCFFHRFKGSLIFILVSFLTSVIILTTLYQAEMLEGFMVTITHFSRDHMVAGGIPIQPFKELNILFYSMILMVMGSIYIVSNEIKRQLKPSAFSLVSLSASLCVAVYFFKYYGRPDLHIYHVVAVAAPGMALLIVSFFKRVEDAVLAARSKIALKINVALYFFPALLLLLVAVPGFSKSNQLHNWLINLAHPEKRFLVENSSSLDGDHCLKGFICPSFSEKKLKLFDYIRLRISKDDTVYDFSDSPLLTYGILGLVPPSKFIHASLAIRPETQRMVIADLAKKKPKYIVYKTDGGLGSWDGISGQVRYHIISGYISQHYSYDNTIAGVIFFRRNDVKAFSDATTEFPTNLMKCDLGFIPNFYSLRKSDRDIKQINIPFHVESDRYLVHVAGWIYDLNSPTPPPVIGEHRGVNIFNALPDVNRSDVDSFYKRPLGMTGFDVSRFVNLKNPDPNKITVKSFNRDDGLVSFPSVKILGNVDKKSVNKLNSISFFVNKKQSAHYLKIILYESNIDLEGKIYLWSDIIKTGVIEMNVTRGKKQLLVPLGGCYTWSKFLLDKIYIGSDTRSIAGIQLIEE